FGPPPTLEPLPGAEPGAEHAERGAYERGARVRRDILGDGDPDRSEGNGGFGADYEEFVTRYAWGGPWERPGLDRRTRFLITLTALTAGGHLDELALHTRAALRGGVTPGDIEETLLHAAVHCGVPAANAAFAVARRVVAEEASQA
ncbi:carboxymuconolactone decarboxylase family protein, partial [Streptomyces sp. UNOC14_S4]|uniref:carboxymuconolactone decarboxylase family protein n=1 Tax=Streptomyces sp. UNOC14_S4 TaxID=2872340 RepID=UPI001E321AC2